MTESAGQGHLDSLGVALLLASLVYLARRRPVRAGVAFALAVMTKYVPLFAALSVVRDGRRGRWRFAAAAFAAGAALWIAASRAGVSPWGGLSDYAARWEFNSVAYPALETLFARTDVPERAKAAFSSWEGRPAWMQPAFAFFYAGFFARAALALLAAAALVTIAWRIRDVETAVFASLATLLLRLAHAPSVVPAVDPALRRAGAQPGLPLPLLRGRRSPTRCCIRPPGCLAPPSTPSSTSRSPRSSSCRSLRQARRVDAIA